jgi:hypothetical protein
MSILMQLILGVFFALQASSLLLLPVEAGGHVDRIKLLGPLRHKPQQRHPIAFRVAD